MEEEKRRIREFDSFDMKLNDKKMPKNVKI